MNASIKETVEELDRIHALVQRLREISSESRRQKAQYEEDCKTLFRDLRPALPKAPAAFGTLQSEVPEFFSDHAKGVKISAVGFVVSLAVWALCSIAKIMGVIGFAFVAMLVFAVWFVVSYNSYAADKKEYGKRAERRARFEEILSNTHSADLLQFQTDLDSYYAQYKLLECKLDACWDTYTGEHALLEEESSRLYDEAAAVTIISQEHLVLAGSISDILKSGRADTLKEALNLAIAEKREEEFRAQQLAEEAHRTQIAEQQAYENRIHNQRVEREMAAQTEHAQAQASIAEAQLQATQQQNKQLKELLDSQKKR